MCIRSLHNADKSRHDALIDEIDTSVRERQQRWLRQQRVPVEGHVLHLLQRMVDFDTHLVAHSVQVSQLARVLSECLAGVALEPTYIAAGALLHDIGKTCLPRGLLQQRTALTPAQRQLIKQHPIKGMGLLARTPALLDFWPFVLYHHERWDGQGYFGLRQWEIPLEARLIALADALSAMTMPQPYKQKKTFFQAVREMRILAGRQFDPQLVQALQNTAGEIAVHTILDAANLEQVLEREKQYLVKLYNRFGGIHHAAVYLQSVIVDHLVLQCLRKKA